MGEKPIEVLLIEDNAGDARLIRELVAEKAPDSFHLEWVERLDEGLRRLAEGGVGLVLLDLLLAEIQGLDTLAKVLAQAPQVPVVVLTVLDDEALAVEAVRQGAQDYLVKGQFGGSLLVRAARYAIERKRAEQTLRESENKYRTLFHAIPDVMFVIDRDYRIVMANQAARTTAARRDPVAARLTCYQVSHHRDTPCQGLTDPCPLKRVFKTKASAKVVHTHYDADGHEIIVEVTAWPIFDEAGDVIQAIEICRDITQRKRAEQALRQAKDAAERARWRAETVNAFSAEVSRYMDPHEIAEVVARHLSGALHTPRCSVVLRTDTADRVEVAALYRDGKPAPFGRDGEMSLDKHPHIAEAMRERRPVLVHAPKRRKSARRAHADPDEPWYCVVVPVATGEEVFATVNIAAVDPQTTYDDQDRMMVETICRHAAQALKKAAMMDALERARDATEAANRRLEELATTDELTGLWNRRRFIEMLEGELRRVRRHRTNLALVMFDVDRFKILNDTYGHAFGDRVLIEAARTLRSRARETDIVARYGGDEFMVLMPDTSTEEAVTAAERMRKKIGRRDISDGDRTVRITISAGIGAAEGDGNLVPDGLVRLADDALYFAKHAGRDCTRTWKQIAGEKDERFLMETEQVNTLRRQVESLSLQTKEMFIQSIQSLAHALGARDPYTKSHSENVTRYAVGIAETMGLEPDLVNTVRRAAIIHDIGKIGVPDAILRKAGPLTPEERQVMEQHVLVGVRILDQMRFLEAEIPIIRHHHERWDGGGYPDGISGEAIPLGARILAVADAFDAITSERVYRSKREVPDALQVLIEEAGRQFDPDVVDALVRWVRDIVGENCDADILKPEDLLVGEQSVALE